MKHHKLCEKVVVRHFSCGSFLGAKGQQIQSQNSRSRYTPTAAVNKLQIKNYWKAKGYRRKSQQQPLRKTFIENEYRLRRFSRHIFLRKLFSNFFRFFDKTNFGF